MLCAIAFTWRPQSLPDRDRLEALARESGWRLEWRTGGWPSHGALVRTVTMFSGQSLLGGTWAMIFAENQVQDADEHLAGLMLQASSQITTVCSNQVTASRGARVA